MLTTSSTIEIEGRANIVIQNLKAEAAKLQTAFDRPNVSASGWLTIPISDELINIFGRSAMAIFTDIEEPRDKIMVFGEQLDECAQYAPDHDEV